MFLQDVLMNFLLFIRKNFLQTFLFPPFYLNHMPSCVDAITIYYNTLHLFDLNNSTESKRT